MFGTAVCAHLLRHVVAAGPGRFATAQICTLLRRLTRLMLGRLA